MHWRPATPDSALVKLNEALVEAAVTAGPAAIAGAFDGGVRSIAY